jgi:hypothetical protein
MDICGAPEYWLKAIEKIGAISNKRKITKPDRQRQKLLTL